MKKTPLYQYHVDAGANMTEFAGYMLPLSFTTIRQEHRHVRESVGVFDVSHMGEFRIRGADALAFMMKVFTGNLEEAENHSCHYGFLCQEGGGIIDDIIVYKESQDNYWMVVNAANIEKDFDWLKSHEQGFDISLEQLSAVYGQIAIQGPKAAEVLDALIPGSRALDFFSFDWFKGLQEGEQYLISRTGYTGEDGFELIIRNENLSDFYEALLSKGADIVQPIGLGARDTLRFEACLPLYGHELTHEISPVEAGLSRFISNPSNYIGRDAHQEHKANPKRHLKAYRLKGKGVPRSEYPIINSDNKEVGYVTTGYLLEGYDYGILLAYVEVPYDQEDTLYVSIRNKRIELEPMKKPFYKKKYKRSESNENN